MFNDSYKDHQLEHRGLDVNDDQLWVEVRKVIQNQTEDPERLLAQAEGEDRGRPTARPLPAARLP